MSKAKTIPSYVSLANEIILALVSVISILLVVLDFFGLTDKNDLISKFSHQSATLVLLSLLSLHLVIRHFSANKFESEFPDSQKFLIESLKGVEIRTFIDASEQEEYLAKRILEAKKRVDDLSWKKKLSPSYGLGKRKKSQQGYEKNISKMSKEIVFREVFIFNDTRRYEKLERRISENFEGYSCRYFPIDEQIPRLQFVIIDSEEIIFASSSYPKLCAIKNPTLCEIFQSYFDDVWSNAVPIMDGSNIKHAEVAKIRDGFNRS